LKVVWPRRGRKPYLEMTDVYPPFRLDQGGQEPGLSAPEGGVPAGT
jgi:hypothetical protein